MEYHFSYLCVSFMKIELSGHYGIGRILKTIIPSVAMIAMTSVYSIVDGFFVSNYAGSTDFAALNLIWPALAIIGAIGLLLGTGGSALVSQLLGEGDKDKANRLFSSIVRIAIRVGIVCTILIFVFMKPLVLALGAEGGMIERAVVYGRIISVSLPFFILEMMFQSFYMTAERPELGTIMSVVCGVSNIGLDALFVVAFGWGLEGAAAATSLTLFIGGLFPLLWFRSKRNTSHLQYVKSNIDRRSIVRCCTNGASEFVGNIALNIIGMCYNLQLMKYVGENGVSAYGIIMYIGFIFASVFIGYNITLSQVIAYNYGAGNKDEIKSLLRKSLLLIGIFGIIMTTVAEISALPIAKIFVGYDQELCLLTAEATRTYMLSFLLCGFNMFVSAWFTALGNGLVSAVAAFTRTLVFELASIFILPSLFGLMGIWNAVNAAEILALILSAILMLAFRKRYGY